MVRAAVGLLCVQRVLCESSLMQNQAQSEHILDALHTGSGRVKKMQQNTEAMENQYKSLLQNIVDSGSLTDPKTGTPFLPSEGFLKTVIDQFETLVSELNSERNTNQELMNGAHRELIATNDNMETNLENNVVPKLTTMRTHRQTHRTCRLAEDVLISDMETKCEDFDKLETKCHEHQDWYAQYDNGDIANVAQETDKPNTLRTLVEKAELCREAVEKLDGKSKTCDDNQRDFKTAYCSYETKMTDACATHKTNYDTEYKRLAATQKSIEDLEKEQKIILQMVRRVECYIVKLGNAKVDAMPEQKDINECVNLKLCENTAFAEDGLAGRTEDSAKARTLTNGEEMAANAFGAWKEFAGAMPQCIDPSSLQITYAVPVAIAPCNGPADDMWNEKLLGEKAIADVDEPGYQMWAAREFQNSPALSASAVLTDDLEDQGAVDLTQHGKLNANDQCTP